MELFIGIAGVIGVVLFVGVKSYAESRLHWQHPLNKILNGDPSNSRRSSVRRFDGTDAGGDV